jgi:hypothetical protein
MPATPNGGTSQSVICVTVPSMVWPSRSMVMPEAPTLRPLPVQLVRSRVSLTLWVTVSPQFTALAGAFEDAGLANARTPARTATAALARV